MRGDEVRIGSVAATTRGQLQTPHLVVTLLVIQPSGQGFSARSPAPLKIAKRQDLCNMFRGAGIVLVFR